ncbi:probable beta-1,3-galactosyltransferase 2 isoform X1 [Tanacetum coccineum]|uniref:Probable beta-1,3-galactosyltransferase 2 isoform X1 n=1 Tax=Tanacetum coccineum TaxID=301880 RepID=A0ABQ4ZW60_9ASTR
MWDAESYINVDDDVHVNIATLGHTLVKHRKKKRVYIGCMKSGPVLAQKGVRYHEPEHWKFGESGNKLDVEHIDDQRLCCGTSPDCEWKAQARNICVASFDWTCSGIGRPVDRIKEVHRRCGIAVEMMKQGATTTVLSFLLSILVLPARLLALTDIIDKQTRLENYLLKCCARDCKITCQ